MMTKHPKGPGYNMSEIYLDGCCLCLGLEESLQQQLLNSKQRLLLIQEGAQLPRRLKATMVQRHLSTLLYEERA